MQRRAIYLENVGSQILQTLNDVLIRNLSPMYEIGISHNLICAIFVVNPRCYIYLIEMRIN